MESWKKVAGVVLALMLAVGAAVGVVGYGEPSCEVCAAVCGVA